MKCKRSGFAISIHAFNLRDVIAFSQYHGVSVPVNRFFGGYGFFTLRQLLLPQITHSSLGVLDGFFQ